MALSQNYAPCRRNQVRNKASRTPNSTTHQQKEAIKRLKAGESCRSIAKIARLTAGA